MTTWILIRHGQSVANQQGVMAGFLETPLSEIGKAQAQELANVLENRQIDYFYSSTSQRAYDTLQPLAQLKKAAIKQEVALKEIHFGDFEGKDFEWIQTHYPREVDKMVLEKDNYCYPKGESLIMAHQRMTSWLKANAEKHKQSVIAVCAHGGTIRSILSQLIIGNESLHWHFKIDNASVSVVKVTDGFAVVESLNDTNHMKHKLNSK